MASLDELYSDWKKKKKDTTLEDLWEERQRESGELQKSNEDALNEISTRVQTWFENSQKYQDLAKSRYSKYDPDNYRGDTASVVNEFTQYNNNFTQEADNIVGLLDTYKDLIDPMYAAEIRNALKAGNKAHESYLSLATQDNDYWSQFDTIQAYRDYRKKQEEYQALLDFDTEAGQKEIDDLNEVLNKKKEYLHQTAFENIPYRRQQTEEDRRQIQAELGLSDEDRKISTKDYENLITEKEFYLNRAKKVQSAKEYTSVTDPTSENYDPEFDRKSQYDQSLASKTPWYDFINKGEKNYAFGSGIGMSGLNVTEPMDTMADGRWKNMTDEEKAIYNYFCNTKGPEEGYKYLQSIAEELSFRTAQKSMEFYQNNPGMEILFGVSAGLDQFKSGIQSTIGALIGSEDSDITPTAALGSYVREDLGNQNWLYRTAYDVVQTTSAQLPSILASTMLSPISGGAAQVVSGAMMFASAGGNAYNEMLRLGYNKNQARTYGALIGASETFLEKLMGGIVPLRGGDGLFGGVSEAVLNKVDNAFARVAISGGFDMLNEFSEEYLQDVLEPVFKNIVFNEKNEVKFFSEEALYSGILGALSAGVMNAPYQVNDIAATEKTGNKIMQAEDGSKRLAELGQTFSPESLAYKIASKVNDKTGAYKIGLLFREAGAVMNDANISEIQAALEEKDIDPQSARTMAEAFASILNNDVITLSDDQKSVIENSELLKDAVWDELIGPNTTAFQRTKTYAEIYTGMNSSTAAQTETNEEPATETKTEAETETKSAPETETKTESKAESKVAVNPNENVRLSDGQTLTDVKIDSTSDRNVVFTAKDESGNNVKVNLNDISLRSKSQQIMANAVATSTVSTDAANMLMKYADNLGDNTALASDALDAYRLGKQNFRQGYEALDIYKRDPIAAGTFYSQGRKEAFENAQKPGNKVVTAPKKQGNVTIENGVTFDTDLKKATLYGAQAIAKLSPLNVHLFESRVENGKRVYTDPDTGETVSAPNGYFRSGTNDIYIDVNAGDKGQGFGLYTLSHEVSHYIRDNNKAGWQEIADTIMENFSGDTPVEKMIADAAAMVRKHSKGKTEAEIQDEAYEEVVADALSRMLTDPTTYDKLAALKQNNPSTWQKIKTAFQRVLAKLKQVLGTYAGREVEKEAAQYVDQFGQDLYNKLQDLYVKAFEGANESYQVRANEKGTAAIDESTESAFPLRSERTWTESEYVQSREETARQMAKDLGVSYKTALRYIDSINSVAALISDDRVRLDYDPNLDPGATVLKPNSEYKYTVDMSTLCAKRLLYTGTFDAIQKALPNTVFDSDAMVDLRSMMMKRGYQVACGFCYVESTRREIGRITQEFIDQYKKAQKTGEPISRVNSSGKEVALTSKGKTFTANKNYTPTLADLNTTDIDLVKRDHREVYDAYLTFMNARGQAKPKLLETRAEYKGEILKTFKNKKAVDERNAAGGLRLQSFSDFEVPHLIDMMQIVMDMSRVGLKSQAYTKVPAFADAFGNTGIKINLSLVAKGTGVDANGNLTFDDVEGINHEEAFRLRDKFSKNVGTILVGKNDAHIIAAMADDRIDFIIPFHKSSWKESLYDALGLTGYDDYTSYQNEKSIDGKPIKNYDPSEYWDYSKTGDENAQIYLQKCKDEGRIPKFPQFQSYPGYWKLLIDFKMYDNAGVGSPQQVVQPIFDNATNEKILEDYNGGHRNLPVAQDVVDDFVKQHKNGIRYSERDTSGNKLTEAQQEYFRDSVARDENGNLQVVYHGSPAKDITVFDRTKAGGHTEMYGDNAIYFTPSKEHADEFSYEFLEGSSMFTYKRGEKGKVYPVYLNMTKPFDLRNVTDEMKNLIWENVDKTRRPSSKEKFLEDVDAMLKYGNHQGLKFYINFGALKDAGYDGIISRMYANVEKDDSIEYGVFDSNQIKSTDNKNPTDNPDIRYSERDSDGNQLSKEQQDYFKNSQARDEAGNLKVLYHGSPRSAFTKFLTSHVRSGVGAFFTDNINVGRLYTRTNFNKADEKLNPYHPTVGMSYERLSQVVEDYHGKITQNNGKVVIKYDDETHTFDNLSDASNWVNTELVFNDDYDSEYKTLYEVYLNLENPLVIDGEGRRWDKLVSNDSQKSRLVKYAYAKDADFESSKPYTIKYVTKKTGEKSEEHIESFSDDELRAKFGEEIADEISLLRMPILYGENDAYKFKWHTLLESEKIYFDEKGNRTPGTTNEWTKYAYDNGYDGVIFKKIRDGSNTPANVYVAFSPNQIKDTANKNPTKSEDIRYSDRITPDMPEDERYQVLKDADIFAVKDEKSSRYSEIENLSMINQRAKSQAGGFANDLAQKLGILNSPMKHNEIEFAVTISKSNGLRESIHQQLKYGGGYKNFGKALVNLREVLENSTLIYRSNKDIYEDTPKKEENFETIVVLLGAFETGPQIIPVKLEIKKQSNIENGNLYVVVSLTEIEKSSVKGRGPTAENAGNVHPVTGFNYSLEQIIKNVNPTDSDFLKYIPDQMLSKDQKAAKDDALKKDQASLESLKRQAKMPERDSAYMELAKNPTKNRDQLQKMVDKAAKEAGYQVEMFHGTRANFNKFDPNMARHGGSGFGYYFGDKALADEFGKGGRVLRVLINNNNIGTIQTHNISANGFASALEQLGLSPEKTYMYMGSDTAEEYANAHHDYRLATDLQYWANDPRKYAKDPLAKGKAPREILTILRKTLGLDGIERGRELVLWDNRLMKLADPVTYDNKGNIIPLSKRFNKQSGDIRYSERNSGTGIGSNRELLAGALESAAQTDIEKSMLERYKKNSKLMDNEQKRLDGIKSRIKELSFAKGPRQTEKINELRQTAKQIESKINAYDKKLLSLEAASPIKAVLEREKKAAFAKAEEAGRQYVKEVRQQMTEKLQSVAERYQESRHQATVNRHRTEVRTQIKDTVSKLNNLLLTNSKDRHVPLELQRSVADALSAINMDTVGAEERLAKIDEQIAKAKTDEQRAKLLATRQRIANAGTNLGDRLSRLQTSYAAIQQSEDPTVRDSYDDVIAALIENTVSQVGDKSIRTMSLEELESVRDMYRAILTRVRDANKLFKQGRQQTITDASEAVKREISETGRNKAKTTRTGRNLSEFAWSLLKPIYAMKAIGSDTLTNLYENVRKGEDKWAINVNNAKTFFQEQAKKYGYNKWDMDKKVTFTDSEGKTFSLSLPQIMSLYAYSNRDQAGEHLAKGGFILGDNIEVTEKKAGVPVKYLVNDTTPYLLNSDDLAKVISALTPNQKAFVDAMQTYLSEDMGALGNEVSRAMYDIDLFKEKKYFPLKTSNFFRDFDPEKAGGTPKLKNASFTKSLVQHASNPIVLDNFMDVWSGHANEMSAYNAFALPLEDFSRVYSYYNTRGGYDSVKQSIRQAYGDAAGNYIERMITALNGGARTDPSAGMANRLINLFKKGATFASASVVIQQPSALPRAFAYIEPKYFAGLKAFNLAKHKQIWEECKKYAPVAMIKEMGYFDINNGMSTTEWIQAPEYETAGEKFKAFFKDSGYRDEVLSKAPAMADELTWAWIWEAAKKKVASTEGLTGEAMLQRAGELFTETITNTQVYDSVLSRSEIMRSKDTAVKMATAFMAEPITSMNMMVDAIRNGKMGNKALAAKTAGAVVSSIILNSVLVSLVYAARKKDDDKTYEEKYLNSLTSEILEGINPITYIPYLKDIWSIAQGFDVERSDMSVVSDLWQSIEKLFSTNTSGLDKVLNVAGAVGTTLGLPVKNLIRDAKALYNVFSAPQMQTTQAGIQSAVSDAIIDSIPLAGRFIGTPSKAQKLYSAATSGDQAQYDRMKAQYGNDQSKIDAALRAQLRANDPRIRAAAEAYNAGDVNEYVDNLNKIVSEGVFSQDLVYKAITAEASAIKSAETSDEETEPQTPKETSIYKAAHAAEAIRSGDTNLMKTVIDDLVRVKEANGSTEKDAKSSVKSSLTSSLKPIYKEAYAAKDDNLMKRIRQGMVSSGLYGSADDVVKTCQNWIKS